MSYELLILPVPPGAAVEEVGEALEVRLAGGHVYVDRSDSGDARRRSLAAVVAGADPEMDAAPDPPAGRVVLARDGVSVEVDGTFVACRVAYTHNGEEAENVFERLFKVARAVVQETGWRLYDPQGACVVGPDDDGRDGTLEIYLSVIDQLIPGTGRDAS